MTYQAFDEKLQRVFEMNPEREQKARDRWAKIKARGLVFYVLTRGSILALWMIACFLFFAWKLGTLHVIGEQGVWESELLCLLLASAAAPWAQYTVSRNLVASLDKREAQRLRKFIRRTESI